MRTAIVLASVVADPESVAETADRLHGEMDTVVVCRDGQRLDISDAADSDHRIVVDPVPDGGPVAAMRAGFRAARTRTAFVTTPGTPQLEREALPTLSPGVGTDATLAHIEGSERPPCGGYVVEPAREACDTTLAMGSRRVSDVLARLTTTSGTVETAPRVTAAAGAAAASTN
jgi:molybdopterin-guanine dinucleotide biosynthesis protein A